MNIAIITAGGSGSRMNANVPKQFTTIYDKPLIVYTIENFQKHPEIDLIIVPCLNGWSQLLKAYIKEYNLFKVKWIVDGGKNGQESIKNALDKLNFENLGDDSIILIHDGVRPLCDSNIISECIQTTIKYGSAIAVESCNEAMLLVNEVTDLQSNKQISRNLLKKTQTPHGFFFNDLFNAHKTALKIGIKESVASCTLMVEIGKTVYFSHGSPKNFKITTRDDLEIFKAIIKSEGNR